MQIFSSPASTAKNVFDTFSRKFQKTLEKLFSAFKKSKSKYVV
jgi:hypothetical protein